MTIFSDILKKLPTIDHIDSLELIDKDGGLVTIENRPGKAGSVAVYNALLQEFGGLNSEAAHRGLELYAEHTEDARANPHRRQIRAKRRNTKRYPKLAERRMHLLSFSWMYS